MTQNRPGTGVHEDDPERNSLQRRLLLLPFCIAVFSLSALFYYHLRQEVISVESPLQVVYAAIYSTFGFAPSLMFFLLLLIWTSIWFFSGKIERPWSRLLRLLATTVMLGVFLNVGETAGALPQQGELGAFFATRMVAAFGYYPTLILVLIATLGALLLATDFLFSETFERLWARSTTGEEPSDPADDFGVEEAVTDHLKGLAAVASPSPRAAHEPAEQRATPAVAAIAPTADGGVPDEVVAAEAHEFEAESGLEAEAEAGPEPEVANPEDDAGSARERRARRRSYFERRQAEKQQSDAEEEDVVAPEGAGPDPEAWLPAPPEAQEIDDPESAALQAEAEAEAAELAEAIGVESGLADEVETEDVESEDVDSGDVEAEDDEEVDVDSEEDEVEDEDVDSEEDEVEDEDVDSDEDVDEDDELDTEEIDGEPVFAIPRPEPAVEPAAAPVSDEASSRQQKLFPSELDESLVDEARQIVLETRRASAAFLRRRLRIGYDEAVEVLAELSARGVVELGEDASQGRVVEQ